jgi:putative heme iron utilization protein
MSKDMRGEFLRTERMSADKRRAVLSGKYGKKK